MVSDRYPKRDGRPRKRSPGTGETHSQANEACHENVLRQSRRSNHLPSNQHPEVKSEAVTVASQKSRRESHDTNGVCETPPDMPRTRTKRGSPGRQALDELCTPEMNSSSRVTTRRSLRSARLVEEEEEEGQDPPQEEQRRSSRQRKTIYSSYNEADITPFAVRRHRKERVSPSPAADEAGENMDTMDMYTRVKRVRRKIKRDMYGMPLVDEEEKSTEDEETENDEEDEDENEEEEEVEEGEDDAEAVRQYNLRRNQPRTQLYVATIEKKTRHNYFKETPPKMRYTERSEIKFKSPAHRRMKRKRAANHRTSSTSSSGSESEDERRFARRKNKSMAKARQRCLPMNLAQSELTHTMKDRQKIGASLADIDPMSLDRSITFDSVGGLADHLQALKEMVVFPLLYPEVFDRFKIAPPRGVLFHGPPGTGKTLVARALANECSTGEKKVAFFMRKGADCLSKWVGESERQLRLLFDQAYQVRPSIIFFDEIDGLAPVRSSRQDQIHSSIVSTLLALMDGLDSRGEVVVIGATNRIDSIDPALRRPGRFDREFLFTLPPVEARADILRIHTREWNPKLLDRFIFEVASKCNGYCGADMKALCTEAALHALRRRYPQIYTSSDKLQLDVTSIDISAADFHYAMSMIVPAGQRAVISPGRPLSAIIKPLLQHQLDLVTQQLNATFPYLTQACTSSSSLTASLLDSFADDSNQACVTECSKAKRKSKQGVDTGPFLDFSIAAYHRPIVSRPRLLLYGDPAQAHGTHLAPALLHCMEKIPVHVLDLPTLYANSAKTPEEACAQVFREARRATPSVIYIPHIDRWWRVLSDTMQATFMMMLSDVDPLMPILLLATADCSTLVLPSEVQELFAANSSELYPVGKPSEVEIRLFFEDLLLKQTCVPPITRKQAARNLLEVLPKVASTKPTQLTDVEETALWKEEETVLRELRLFLRDMLNKLARDRKFNIFSKPVDIEEVPDYHDIINTPMDLSTMMSKIDLHQYQACREFLDDIDLICANALEYNPADSVAGKAIRHRACALKDMAHALIETELDVDFEQQCGDILESRHNRGKSPSKSAPKYYHTKHLAMHDLQTDDSTTSSKMRYSRRLRREDVPKLSLAEAEALQREMSRQRPGRVSHDITQDDRPSPVKKRRKSSRKTGWAKGHCPPKKRSRISEEAAQDECEEEEKAGLEEQSQVNGDLPNQPEETATTHDKSDNVAAKQLPVGDVTRAKLDLTERLDDCSHNVDNPVAVATADADAANTTDPTAPAIGHNMHSPNTQTLSPDKPQPDVVAAGTVAVAADEEPVKDVVTSEGGQMVNGSMTAAEHPDSQSSNHTSVAENVHDLDANDTSSNDTVHSSEMVTSPTANEKVSPTTNEKPSPVANEKPSSVANEKLSPVTNEKPSPVTNEKPLPVTNEDSELTNNKHSPMKLTNANDSRTTNGKRSSPMSVSPIIHEKVLELGQPKRMTRSMTNDHQLLRCREILAEPLPAFIIDQTMLPGLLDKAVAVGLHCSVAELEKLYSVLAQRIYHHRESYDKTMLFQELDEVLSKFAAVTR